MKAGPKVVSYDAWEVCCMRLGFAVLLWLRLPATAPQLSQPAPNGIAEWVDLTFLSNAAVFEPLRWLFLAMLVVYVGGRGLAWALPFLLFLNVCSSTLGNSQGWIGHTDQIVSLLLLVQTLFHMGLFIRKRLPGSEFTIDRLTAGRLEIFFSLQTIAATYVTAGLTKLLKTGGMWIAQLPDIAVQIVKTNDQFYYDHLTHPRPGLTEWLNQLLLTHPSLVYMLFGPGLLVELGAFYCVFGRKSAAVMGLILLVMHLLICLVMQITFTANIWLIVVYLLNLPFWSVTAFRYLRARFQRSPSA